MSEPNDVRGHFPYHEYEHPTDHDHDSRLSHDRGADAFVTELDRALDLIRESPSAPGPYKDGYLDAIEAVRDELTRAALRSVPAPTLPALDAEWVRDRLHELLRDAGTESEDEPDHWLAKVSGDYILARIVTLREALRDAV